MLLLFLLALLPFTVIGNRFDLYKAGTFNSTNFIKTLSNNSDIPLSGISIIFIPSDISNIDFIRFYCHTGIDDLGDSIRLESAAPYAIAGDMSGGTILSSWTPPQNQAFFISAEVKLRNPRITTQFTVKLCTGSGCFESAPNTSVDNGQISLSTTTSANIVTTTTTTNAATTTTTTTNASTTSTSNAATTTTTTTNAPTTTTTTTNASTTSTINAATTTTTTNAATTTTTTTTNAVPSTTITTTNAPTTTANSETTTVIIFAMTTTQWDEIILKKETTIAQTSTSDEPSNVKPTESATIENAMPNETIKVIETNSSDNSEKLSNQENTSKNENDNSSNNNMTYVIVGSSVGGLLILSAGSILLIRKRRSRLAEQRMQGRYESMIIQHQLEQNMRQNPLAVDGDGSVWSFFESESNYIS